VLILAAHFVERINKHARLAYPDECCGFLFGLSDGDLKHVTRLHELANESGKNRTRRYLITPEQFRNAEQWAEEKSYEILGLYHSHPDHPSRPSQFDLDHALPWWSYAIVSVERGTPSLLSSWVLKDDRSEFIEERVAEWSERMVE
jgi:proteasome lid subunit RPN8/RPN11